ncbi:uncharacterized protein LOC142986605 [Anticarsia gemmatalis]|uniref:uncharacterized protein LOC142986605 n=1 Tax=Anticarsia gemmatalis TaxID=129554 RepID=UPI003F76D57D
MAYRDCQAVRVSVHLATDGVSLHDHEALLPYQQECLKRYVMSVYTEQELHMYKHPEILALLKTGMKRLIQEKPRKDPIGFLAKHYTRPCDDIDAEVREYLNVVTGEPYTHHEASSFTFKDETLRYDLENIIKKHNPVDIGISVVPSKSATKSSSFISIVTSDTTLPTPVPTPVPEPTISEVFFGIITNTVDKVVYGRLDDNQVNYDTAYVELMKAVEDAMEITVRDIKRDIAELYYDAYDEFERIVKAQEEIAYLIAWERRMRKKLKKSLRRQKNFKGYETPKSGTSSHESYIKPAPPPCVCQPRWKYNRYPKDRFGIYLPRITEFSDENKTITPTISFLRLTDPEEAEDAESTSVTVSDPDSIKRSLKKRVVIGGKTKKPLYRRPDENEKPDNA